ncbi:50S ribosomal protein L11 methyltransferase [bacterium]|nr:50S ribosomal protein L11 methyltransferase [bacterium]
MSFQIEVIVNRPEHLEAIANRMGEISGNAVEIRDEGKPARVLSWVADESLAGTQGREIAAYLDALSELWGEKPGEVRVSPIDDEDWSESWKRYFRPLRIGERIVVRPSWEDYETALDEIAVVIDPASAFGTGQHETTAMALEFVDRQARLRPGATFGDMGTGSGILAIAAVRLGFAFACGVDVDAAAARAAHENAIRNEVGDATAFFAATPEGVFAWFDVVAANLDSPTLIRHAEDLSRLVAPGGVIGATGIFHDRRDDVEKAFAEYGLSVTGEEKRAGWVLLELSRNGA